MRILTRYVLFDFLRVFLITLTAATGLILITGVVREAANHGIGIGPILALLPYMIPESLRFAVPASALFATCVVFGQMAANNEVIASKASGISPLYLMRPVIITGLALSFLSVWINDIAVTWGRAGIQRVIVQSVEQIAYGMLRKNRQYATSDISINVKEVRGKDLIRPTVTVKETDDQPAITIVADKADLQSDPDQGTLTIRFHNAIFDADNGGITWPGVYEHTIALSDFSNRTDKSSVASNQALSDIPQQIRDQKVKIANLKQEYAATAAYQLMTGQFEELNQQSWNNRQRYLKGSMNHLYRLQTETWRRWSNGFSCLCFVLIGVPLAIQSRRRDIITSFAFCFFPILIVYYPLLLGSVDRAKSGELPAFTVWSGNIVLSLWGLWLMRKVFRY